MRITKDDLGVIEAASKEKVHPVLSCTRVEPGALVCTDGRILCRREIAMEEEGETFEPFQIEGRALKNAKGIFAKNSMTSLRAGVNGTATIQTDGGAQVQIKKEEGTVFPEYRRVFPADREDAKTVLLDPALLSRLLKTFKGAETVKITINSPDVPMRLEAEIEGRKVEGLIMPKVQT